MSEAIPGGARVAYFGGSFDPPHLGHLAVARAARAALRLDVVLFAPVGAQPLKIQGSTASFADRVEMTRLAIDGEPGMSLSLADAPIPAGAPNYSPNYSIDTLTRLRAELPPGCVLFCLMGADSFLTLRLWHRAPEVPFIAPLIVVSRPGQQLEDLKQALPPGLSAKPVPCAEQRAPEIEVRCYTLESAAGSRAPFYLLPNLFVEISASDIRAHLRANGLAKEQRRLLPEPVVEYIQTHGLYRE